MIEPLEIADTAVKIGLGAIISVIGTYVLARFAHKKDLEEFYLNRHVVLLEATAEEEEQFATASLDYWAALAEENDYANQRVRKALGLNVNQGKRI